MFETLQKKYFDVPLSRGLTALFIGKTIVMIASSLLGIFLPVFLYEKIFNENFWPVALFYGLGYGVYGLTVFFGARFLNRFGFRRALRWSVVLGALFFVIFYFMNSENWIYLLPLSFVVVIFYRLLYWIPYHVDFAKFTDKKNRGRQVSMFFAARYLFGIFMPLVSGFLILKFGFNTLFVLAILLYLVSGVSYLIIPRTKEKFSWSLRQTWKEMVSKKRRGLVFAYFADGAETVVGLIVWPVFIFILLSGNYFIVGLVFTVVLAVTTIIQLILGRYVDLKTPKEKVLGWGSVFYALGWLIKIFIVTAFQIFVVDTYHRIARVFIRTPFDAMTYDIAADQGHYVDELTVLHEIAISLGKAFMMGFTVLISIFLGIQWVFVLAALAAVGFNLLRKQNKAAVNTPEHLEREKLVQSI